MSGNAPTVLWQPQAGPQKALIDCPLPEIFYGGARGGGKTDGILGKYALKANAYKDKFNAVFFRKEMPQQDDLIDRAKEIYIPLGAQWLEAKKRFNFPGGGRVRFRPMETVADAEKYQGQNLSDASVEEAGNYPSSAPIDRLFGALRSTAGVPVQMILTANPGGPGHHWIKQRYIEPHRDGFKVIRRVLPDGSTHRSVFIPSLLRNNRILMAKDPNYASRLQLVGSPELVRAWLEGDWDVIAGAYFPEFSKGKHVLVDAEFPKEWRRFTATDWGSSRPFWTGWFVIVQKEMRAHTATGAQVTLLPGALVCYREWYGEDKERPSQNIGLKLPIEEWAKGVLERCREDVAYHTVDTSMFAEDGGPSLAERAMKVSVKGKRLSLRRADKRRLPGWNQVRYRLRGDAEGMPPMLFFTLACPDATRTLAALQHDDAANKFEDADSDGEDHACFAAGTWVNGEPVESIGLLTRRAARVVRLTFEDGRQIVCTPDHEFLGADGKWRQAQNLSRIRCVFGTLPKSSWASSITAAALIFSARACDFIAWCGRPITARFLTAGTFTTGTGTAQKTGLPTSSYSARRITPVITMPVSTAQSQLGRLLPQLSGMVRPPGLNGTAGSGMPTWGRSWLGVSQSLARYAGGSLRRAASLRLARAFATRTARPLRCVGVEPLSERRDVYCLPTKRGWLVADGLIASNCDGIRYGCMSRPRQLPDPKAMPKGPKPGSMDWITSEAWKTTRKGYNVDRA